MRGPESSDWPRLRKCVDLRQPISGWQQPEILRAVVGLAAEINSGGLSIEVVQHTAQTLAPQEPSPLPHMGCIRAVQPVPHTFDVALAMIRQNEPAHPFAHRTL